ncbi:carbohydrate ABC transporter permease [Shouchella clausii]|jgi:multiple sugar transport system permease protein|uniref:Sugar ABC transporter permease n=1 Tax=Shouchella clausii TaxID=79880 RepID=A0A268S150_SHOCL|nr:sugar ABC transporter permease [Shouchella clausii]PAD44306.1 sugar ABC transporter permease [Bacillus sp. 7520-S]SPU21323.1 sugar ABC transporter permease [Niallia circulans]AST94988.1 sugar ABC transporter permease [Shouchella clausii]MBU8596188.1 sugar ABC transporter permease [Shouchella clausii]MCM3549228.1 sugar ABC transporter permease [Shouchella clausii]
MYTKREKWWGYAFIAPQLLGMIVFSLLPLIFAFALSFMSWDGFGERTFVGLDNYIQQFQDPVFRTALRNTTLYSLLVIPGGIIAALGAALALNKVKGKDFYRMLFFMPVVTSSVSIGVIWMWLLNGDIGLINQLLAMIGIDGPNWLTDQKLVLPSIAALSIWWGLGTNMVIFLAGLQGISRSYYEAADIDGATPWQKFRHITFPLLSPTTFFVAIMIVIASFQVFDQAYVMTQGGPGKASYTLVYHIFDMAFTRTAFGPSTASAMILFAIILIFTLIQFSVSRKWVHYEDGGR